MPIEVAASRATAPALARIEAWTTRNAGEATAWVVFLLGLLLVSDALPLR
ncbi:hypothetical protein [Geodermatophilus normandii]|nr:hypothetical protein [Geodermatophilus normandii]